MTKEIGQRPKQRIANGKPTHAIFHEDGTTSIVHPEGYDPADLVKLPRGYHEDKHEPDHESRSFVKRKVPIERHVTDAEKIEALTARVHELERRVAELSAK